MQLTNFATIVLLFSSALSVIALPVQPEGATLEARLAPTDIGYVRTEKRLPGMINKWWEGRKAAHNMKQFLKGLEKQKKKDDKTLKKVEKEKKKYAEKKTDKWPDSPTY
ncbi:hypothetical protein HYFRA_00002604 [Hymenoscyphus fraxineus]|uniref:Uncharacterized protein n=1 Tax=Hymenoscyphus fraxineus TaxID=746836 RepID=A0A9N9LCP8_9HELO|nr:hypothetical protein HYFRA_00002604 [Hymenoscyphus fraxineus]